LLKDALPSGGKIKPEGRPGAYIPLALRQPIGSLRLDADQFKGEAQIALIGVLRPRGCCF
jgi:hypothetical protein